MSIHIIQSTTLMGTTPAMGQEYWSILTTVLSQLCTPLPTTVLSSVIPYFSTIPTLQINDYICMHNVFQFYPERVPLSGVGGITLFFTQSRFVYTTVVNHTVITENNGSVVGGLFAVFINSPHTSFLTITGYSIISKNTMLIPFCPGSGIASYIYFTHHYIHAGI